MYNVKMVELKTAEHIVHFMKQNINLSRFDERFIDSLQHLTQVTTNQVELFYKIIYKYRRQFVKHEMDIDKLLYLPWTIKVIESSPTYTDGHISIEDGNIIFKCPYNKNFINEFRKQPHNSFTWDKERRLYSTKFSTYQLKLLVNSSTKFFKTHYCHVTTELLEQLKPYEGAKYWQPTLCRINGNLYIVAMNTLLDEVLGDMVLNTEPVTLATLTRYGITIDESVYDTNDNKQKFMANMFCKVEFTDVLNIVPWLKELNCDCVYFSTHPVVYAETINQLVHEFDKEKIYFQYDDFLKDKNASEYNFPVILRFKSATNAHNEPFKVGKIIQFVNSQPVEIK